jgi:acetyl-CoA carboxylase biotin carboxyl carrier protein
MRLTVEEIREILALVQASGCEEFRLETGDVKLVVRRGGAPAGDGADGPDVAKTDPGVPRAVTALPVVEPVPDSLVAVTAPMMGTFYRAPSPGAPPFVEVGGRVTAADTIGILEVMKLMNSIAAGAHGRVARICAENGAPVTQGQPLVLIAPDEESGGG